MKRLFLTLFVILTAISAGYSSIETHYVHNCHCGSITVDGLALMLQIPVSGDARTHLIGEPVVGDDMVMGLAYTVSAFFPPAKISTGAQVAVKGTQIVTKTGTTAFKHNFKYASRVRMRAIQDPVSHNFPYSFDDAILSTTPILKNNVYKIFRQSGTLTGKNGVFEIGVTKDGIIDHRFFRPVK